MTKSLRLLAGIAILGSALASGEVAALDAPKGPVILTVTGQIQNKNTADSADFDLDMLQALQGRAASVETPWTTGKTLFEGPLGSALLQAVGATGSKLKVTAINNYSAEIPVEDFQKYPVILATKKDGKTLSVRDKGPIFVIYPFDKEPSLYNEVYFNRSVWQVKAISVE